MFEIVDHGTLQPESQVRERGPGPDVQPSLDKLLENDRKIINNSYLKQLSLTEGYLGTLDRRMNSKAGRTYSPPDQIRAADQNYYDLNLENLEAMRRSAAGERLQSIAQDSPVLILAQSTKESAGNLSFTEQTLGKGANFVRALRTQQEDPIAVALLAGRLLREHLEEPLNNLPLDTQRQIQANARHFAENLIKNSPNFSSTNSAEKKEELIARIGEAFLYNEAARKINVDNLSSAGKRIWNEWNDCLALDGNSFNLRDSTSKELISGTGMAIITLPAMFPMGVVAGGIRALTGGAMMSVTGRYLSKEVAEYAFAKGAQTVAKGTATAVATKIGVQSLLLGAEYGTLAEMRALFSGEHFWTLPNGGSQFLITALQYQLRRSLLASTNFSSFGIDPAKAEAARGFFTTLLGRIQNPAARAVVGQVLSINLQAGGGVILNTLHDSLSPSLTAYEREQATRYLGEKFLAEVNQSITTIGMAAGSKGTASIFKHVNESKAGDVLRNWRDPNILKDALGVERARAILQDARQRTSGRSSAWLAYNCTYGMINLGIGAREFVRWSNTPNIIPALAKVAAHDLLRFGFDGARWTEMFIGSFASKKARQSGAAMAVDFAFGAQTEKILTLAVQESMLESPAVKLASLRNRIGHGDLKGASIPVIVREIENNGLTTLIQRVDNYRQNLSSGGGAKRDITLNVLVGELDAEIRLVTPRIEWGNVNASSGVQWGNIFQRELAAKQNALRNEISPTTIATSKPDVPYAGKVEVFLKVAVQEALRGSKLTAKGTERNESAAAKSFRDRLPSLGEAIRLSLQRDYPEYNMAKVAIRRKMATVAFTPELSQLKGDKNPLKNLRLDNSAFQYGKSSALSIKVLVTKPPKFEDREELTIIIPYSDLIKSGFFGDPESLIQEMQRYTGKVSPSRLSGLRSKHHDLTRLLEINDKPALHWSSRNNKLNHKIVSVGENRRESEIILENNKEPNRSLKMSLVERIENGEKVIEINDISTPKGRAASQPNQPERQEVMQFISQALIPYLSKERGATRVVLPERKDLQPNVFRQALAKYFTQNHVDSQIVAGQTHFSLTNLMDRRRIALAEASSKLMANEPSDKLKERYSTLIGEVIDKATEGSMLNNERSRLATILPQILIKEPDLFKIILARLIQAGINPNEADRVIGVRDLMRDLGSSSARNY